MNPVLYKFITGYADKQVVEGILGCRLNQKCAECCLSSIGPSYGIRLSNGRYLVDLFIAHHELSQEAKDALQIAHAVYILSSM